MRIWLAPSAFFPARGGVEELTLQLAREYVRVGHDVMVVVHRHPAELPRREVVEGVPVARVLMDLPGSALGRLARYPLDLARTVGELRALGPAPDVVHVQCPANQLPAITGYAARARIPLVVTTQGEVTMDAHQIYQQSAQMRTGLRVASRAAAALTACSTRAALDAATVAPRFAGAEVVPNGVDPAQWTVTPLPEQPVYAAWGRHVRQKGLDLLIGAFARVRDDLPEAVLRIAGDGSETAALRALAGPGVEFLGPLDRAGVQRLLADSRVAVVPSRLEPFGIVAVEAMAAGRTVVWSTSGGLDEATGGLGYGVDPTDPAALARAMVTAYQAPVPVAQARAHAESLSWARIAARYLAIYSRCRTRR